MKVLTDRQLLSLKELINGSIGRELACDCLSELISSSAWCHILFLSETDNLSYIDKEVIEDILNKTDGQNSFFFPKKNKEIESDKDSLAKSRHFCFLGQLINICSKKELDFRNYISWFDEWLIDYQLPDGSYNYGAQTNNLFLRNSVVTTVAILEGILAFQNFTGDASKYYINLEKGLKYLLKNQVYLSPTGEKFPETDWDKIVFPRFHRFDFVRGLDLILDFILKFDKEIDFDLIEKSFLLLKDKKQQGLKKSEKKIFSSEKRNEYNTNTDQSHFDDKFALSEIVKRFHSCESVYVKQIIDKAWFKYLKARDTGLLN